MHRSLTPALSPSPLFSYAGLMLVRANT